MQGSQCGEDAKVKVASTGGTGQRLLVARIAAAAASEVGTVAVGTVAFDSSFAAAASGTAVDPSYIPAC